MSGKIEWVETIDYEPNTNMEYRHLWVKVADTNIKYELVQTSTRTWKLYQSGKLVLDNVPQKDLIAFEPVLRRALKRIESGLSIKKDKKFGDVY